MAEKKSKAPTPKDVGSLYEVKGRHFYTDDRSVAGLPDFLEVQIESYNQFLHT